MSDSRTDIILAAINAAGERDEAWYSRVISNARDIALLVGEKSDLAQMVDGLIDPDVKVFPATITSVKKEAKSTRGVVYMRTGTERESKDIDGSVLESGMELARTDRTDNEVGRTLANQLRALRGHRVLIFLKLETMANGNKVRTIIGAIDQGVDKSETADAA